MGKSLVMAGKTHAKHKGTCTHPEGCTDTVRCKGLCSTHYMRQKQEERRRAAGVLPAVDLGPTVRVEVLLPLALEARLDKCPTAKEARADFIRRAILNQLRMEEAAGREVVIPEKS